MDDPVPAPWQAEVAPLPEAAQVRALEDRLKLTDRIVVLEAKLAEITSPSASTPTEVLTVEQELMAMQTSSAWRIGSLLTDPRRLLRRLTGRR